MLGRQPVAVLYFALECFVFRSRRKAARLHCDNEIPFHHVKHFATAEVQERQVEFACSCTTRYVQYVPS